MNYPLFDDTIVIVNPDKTPVIKHIPNNKYNISEDLVLKLKEIFAGKNCNIIFGGTINEHNTICLLGDELFRQQSHADVFRKYLIDYSNWNKIVKEIRKDLINGTTTYFEENMILKFVPEEYSILGTISEFDKGIVSSYLRKYQDTIGTEVIDKKQYLEIQLYPVLKQHSAIPVEKEFTKDEIRKLIFDNLEKPIKDYFDGKIQAVNECKNENNKFIVSLEPIDLDWEIDREYVSDFQEQYGYEPDSSDCYYTYDSNKVNELGRLIDNILEPLGFSSSHDYEISTEYRFVEFEIEYNGNIKN